MRMCDNDALSNLERKMTVMDASAVMMIDLNKETMFTEHRDVWMIEGL